MSYGPIKVFTGTVASGASSTQIALDKAYSKIFAEISTMSTTAAWDVFGSSDGTTYRPVLERINTAPVQYQTLTVASGIGTNGGIVPIEPICPYLQFRASAVVSGGVTIKLHCID